MINAKEEVSRENFIRRKIGSDIYKITPSVWENIMKAVNDSEFPQLLPTEGTKLWDERGMNQYGNEIIACIKVATGNPNISLGDFKLPPPFLIHKDKGVGLPNERTKKEVKSRLFNLFFEIVGDQMIDGYVDGTYEIFETYFSTPFDKEGYGREEIKMELTKLLGKHDLGQYPEITIEKIVDLFSTPPLQKDNNYFEANPVLGQKSKCHNAQLDVFCNAQGCRYLCSECGKGCVIEALEQEDKEKMMHEKVLTYKDVEKLFEWATKEGWRGHAVKGDVFWLNINDNSMKTSAAVLKSYHEVMSKRMTG